MKKRNLEMYTSIPVLLEGLPSCSLSAPLLYFKLLFDRQRCYIKGTEVTFNVIVTEIFQETNSGVIHELALI